MRFAWLAALCLFAPFSATPRPYTVNDLLAVEDYGRAVFAPDGRLLVIERLRGQARAARFTYDYFVRRARSRVMVAEVAGGGLKPLFPEDSRGGYWIGGFSPSGRRLAIFRLLDDRVTLGVVDMRPRRVRWYDIAPDLPHGAVEPIWIDEGHLVFVARSAGNLPLPLDFGGRAQRQLPRLWATTASGLHEASSSLGSGRYLGTSGAVEDRRLVSLDLAAGTVHTLARGHIVDLSLSPDRRHVAIVEQGALAPAPAPDQPMSLDFRSQRLRLLIVSADGAIAEPCSDCDVAPDLLSWSTDGARLMFLARRDGEAWAKAALMVATSAAGTAAPLDLGGLRVEITRLTPGIATARAGWSGRAALVLGRRGDGPPVWYRVSQGRVAALADNVPGGISAPLFADGDTVCARNTLGLWRIAHDGTATLIGPGSGLHVVGLAAGSYDVGLRPVLSSVIQGSSVTLRAPGASGDELLNVACASGSVRRTTIVRAGADILATAGGNAVFATTSLQGIVSLDLAGRTSRRLDRLNSGFAAIDAPRTYRIERADGGEKLSDWLLLPPAARPGTKLPLVVMPYPGERFGLAPPGDFGLGDFEPELTPALFAAHGYAVLQPSLPVGAAEPAQDIIAQVRLAIAATISTGLVDPARIAVYGHSYGGYTALVMATEMTCLRAVVASASFSDLAMFYGAFDPRVKVDFADGFETLYPFAYAEDGQGRMGTPPWTDPARYIRNSPFYQLDRVRAPILLLHGDLDPIGVEQAERTFAALYRLGKDARLLRYYGEGHVPASPANIRGRWRDTLSFLAENLALTNGAPSFGTAGQCIPSGP